MMKETKGNRLHSIMANKGISIADLAYRIGCSRADVAKWCADILDLTDNDVRKIAIALRMPSNELIGLLN